MSDYANLRRTQFNLRLLSFRRQSLDDDTLRAALTPVGKQTVAAAAGAKNSSLRLYTNGEGGGDVESSTTDDDNDLIALSGGKR